MVRWEPMSRIHQNGHGKEGPLDEMILSKSIFWYLLCARGRGLKLNNQNLKRNLCSLESPNNLDYFQFTSLIYFRGCFVKFPPELTMRLNQVKVVHWGRWSHKISTEEGRSNGKRRKEKAGHKEGLIKPNESQLHWQTLRDGVELSSEQRGKEVGVFIHQLLSLIGWALVQGKLVLQHFQLACLMGSLLLRLGIKSSTRKS